MTKQAKKEFSSANILVAEVATTGPMGGDAGHGGKTSLKLTNNAATSWLCVIVDEYGKELVIEHPRSVMISVQGDTELETFSESLHWAGTQIKSLARNDITQSSQRSPEAPRRGVREGH